MRFNATEYQIKQIAVNACKAQLPVFCKHLKPEDIDVDDRGLVIVDTVKLIIRRVGESQWEIDDEIDRHWHGWIDVYPTARDLVYSVIKPTDVNRPVSGLDSLITSSEEYGLYEG
jgi:hypothetical protein